MSEAPNPNRDQRGMLDRWFRKESISGDGLCPTYLWRWTLLRLGERAVYLHHFVGDDWTRDLHDHPKRFISFGLWGRYVEETPEGERVWRAPWIRSFPATHRHRLRLIDKRPCWTLVIVLKSQRAWGFWHNGKWVPWRTYLKLPAALERKSMSVSEPTNITPDERGIGWQFAFFHSLSLAIERRHRGNWFAPGYSIESKYEDMPNTGKCACGEGYLVSDVYRFGAESDGVLHGRKECV